MSHDFAVARTAGRLAREESIGHDQSDAAVQEASKLIREMLESSRRGEALGAVLSGTLTDVVTAIDQGSESLRIDEGVSDVSRLDHIYETPDWERASGRADAHPAQELIG